MSPVFSISIVSHGHGRYIRHLLQDLVRLDRSDFDVILTLNLPEDLPLDITTLPYRVMVINNDFPKGFAANHNAAFRVSQGDNFVILNPDIRLIDDPFITVLSLMNDSPEAIYAPSVVNEAGELADSARSFPTPLLLLKKLLEKVFNFSFKREVIPAKGDVLMPDWVAGMFVVVPRAIYENLHGLSERYHMYYEDVDFCARARLAGYSILVGKNAKVIHEAQRDSHKTFRYFIWHLSSMVKFFISKAYLKICLRRMWDAWVLGL